MKRQSQKLADLLDNYTIRLSMMEEEEMEQKTSPSKWSKKEIVGHLVDSAQNNIQRFIRAQIQDNYQLIKYEQDKWVELNNYQSWDEVLLVQYFRSVNQQVIMIWEKMPNEQLTSACVVDGDTVTLEWIMDDYLVHMEHHLKQIFPDND
ncbi:DinB family protein [Limibacter armeniacum]|uniref:DinB family protein n=1 Tax=Limibacter armeniacum TaxID=466084 RepID=UPI002FE5E6D0